jgi:hypothetical protein
VNDPINDHLEALLAVLLIKDGIEWAERQGNEIRYITTDGVLVGIRFQVIQPEFPPPRRKNLITRASRKPLGLRCDPRGFLFFVLAAHRLIDGVLRLRFREAVAIA